MGLPSTLIDAFGRVHTDLRISVTDRCNLRCCYCMPAQGVSFCTHDEILTFEEIARFVRVGAGLGVSGVRLTGGEPLVRRHVCRLVEMLARVPGVDDLAMTTNAVLLAEHAAALKAAGLGRLNISLDTLDRSKFQRITGCDDLPRVLEGIEAAREAGFRPIKLNALAVRGLTEEDVVPLARFARARGLQLRFIEFMPLDGDAQWDASHVLSGEEILRILTETVGPLESASPPNSHAPAVEYRFVDGCGTIGLIHAVSRPFCDRCNRLRLTAEGQVRNCLFSREEWDARALLRAGGTDRELADLIRRAIGAKKAQHGTEDGQLARTQRTMHQIGG